MTIGEAIRKARKDREFTLTELAKRTGVAYQTLLNWERGLCFPDIMTLIDVADALDISLDELVGREQK